MAPKWFTAMRNDPEAVTEHDALMNEWDLSRMRLIRRDLAWYFWKFVHNGLIHPLLALPIEPKCAQRAHDWTAKRCIGGG